MKVAILGSGGIGLGMAATLCNNGHDPVIWSPSGKGTQAFVEGATLTAKGAISGKFQPRIASSCEEAMADAACVIFALPAYGHRPVMDIAAKYAKSSQTMIISSQYSLSSLYLKNLLDQHGVAPLIIGWGTTMLMAGLVSPGEIEVYSVRNRVDLATIPASQVGAGIEISQSLFGDRFIERKNIIAIELSNINPPVHMANALCNLTRIEKGENWDHYGSLTPSVARLIEGLDIERLDLARAFNVEVKTIGQHMSFTFGGPIIPLAESARQASLRGGPAGPKSLKSRWINEDFPFGIAPIIALADIAGLPVPLHRSGYVLFDSLLGRNLTSDNDILPSIKLATQSPETLTNLVS